MKTLGRRREKASTVESLLLRGVKTLKLSTPEERTCTRCYIVYDNNGKAAEVRCGQKFVTEFATRFYCDDCIRKGGHRSTEEELRATRAEERRRRMVTAGLTGDLAEMTFARFNRSLDPEAYEAARRFVDNWAESNLILLGVVGSGKTHLVAAIAHELLDQAVDVRYAHIPSLGYELRSAGSGDAWAAVAQARINPLREADVAILDDLGREKSTDAWAEAIDMLINHRVNQHAPLVVTANLETNELRDHIGAAAVSRLLKPTTPVHTVAVDRRLVPARVPPIPEALRDPCEQCATCAGTGWVVDTRPSVGTPDRLQKCPSCQGRGW